MKTVYVVPKGNQSDLLGDAPSPTPEATATQNEKLYIALYYLWVIVSKLVETTFKSLIEHW